MEPLEGLAGFVAIVERGSLAAAAKALGVSRPTLSRQLAALEAQVGVRLLHRTTRRLVATRAGEELFQRSRGLVEEARAALDAVRRHDDVPRGLLRISVPPRFADLFGDVLLSFLRRWPEVQLEVQASARFVDLVAEGYDVAIRARVGDQQDLVSRPLVRTDLVALASPAYLARRGRPTHVGQLAEHDLLLGFEAGHSPETTWPLRDGGRVPVRGRLATDDLDLRRRAAIQGEGITLLPHLMIVEAVRAGELEVILYDALGFLGASVVVWPERAFLQPKVRAFVDHVVASAAAMPAFTCPERPGG